MRRNLVILGLFFVASCSFATSLPFPHMNRVTGIVEEYRVVADPETCQITGSIFRLSTQSGLYTVHCFWDAEQCSWYRNGAKLTVSGYVIAGAIEAEETLRVLPTVRK